MGAIGQPLRRKEDVRLLTGKGLFSDDFCMEGQVYAVMVRSPHPHAPDRPHVNAVPARSMPGVLGVFSGADCLADGLGPIPHSPVPSTRYDMKLTAPGGGKIFIGPHLLLPVDKARHVGEAVAMVVAETAGAGARCGGSRGDRIRSASLDYQLRSSVHGRCSGHLGRGARQRPRETRCSVMQSATDRAFAACRPCRQDGFPHRPRDRSPDGAASGAGALRHAERKDTRSTPGAAAPSARSRSSPRRSGLLRIDCASFPTMSAATSDREIAPMSNSVSCCGRRASWAGRSKYTATRSEAFLSDYQGRDLLTKVELALRSDGRFLAMRALNVSNVGARCVSLSPLGKGAGLITGSYDIPAASLHACALFTNTMPTNAYRSSGRPEVTFALERLIDIAAADLGFDRIKLRRINLIRPVAMPYTNAVGMTYDSGEYEANMDLAMRIADWDGFEARRRNAAGRGRLLGRGLANYVESSIGAPKERTDITVTADFVTVVIGTQPSGQGHETSFAQVVSDLLGLAVENINIFTGDTDIVSVGGGSHSGRSLRHAATVMSKAAEELIARARVIAARLLDLTPDQIEFADGRFGARSTNRSFSLLELARELARSTLPDELKSSLRVTADNEMHDPVFPNGCAVCECEVDAETGGVELTRYAAVDDVGRCINPMIVHGQTHGGIAQGVGQALWEQCCLDPRVWATRQWLAHGLRHAAVQQSPVIHNRDCRGSIADQPLRHQGRWGRWNHAGPGRRDQRDRQCPKQVSHLRHHDAGDPLCGLARNPEGKGSWWRSLIMRNHHLYPHVLTSRPPI